jgi:FAD/FMN-containing dehydrogenase
MTNRADLILKLKKKINWIDFIKEMENCGFLVQNSISNALLNNQKRPINSGNVMLVNNLIEGGAIKDTSLLHIIPYIIFRPLVENQLRHIINASREFEVPISFAGGKTGLSGAYANFGIIVDLADLHSNKESIHVDLEKGIVHVEQNVLISDLIKKIPLLSNNKYIFPIQPASAFKLPVRIGGIISTDASGVTSGKLGSVSDWLEEIRIMTPEGKCINISKNDPYFTKIVRGNGYFGIVLNATFKLYQPETDLKQAIIFGDDINSAFNGLQQVLENKIFPLISEFVISPFKLPGKFANLSETIKWATLIQGSVNEVESFMEIMKSVTECSQKWLNDDEFDEFLKERSTFALLVQTSDNISDFIAFPGFEDVLSPPKHLPEIIASINNIFERNGFQKIIFGYGHINFRRGMGLLLHLRLPVPINYLYKENQDKIRIICKTIYEVIYTLKSQFKIKHKAEHSPGPFRIWLEPEFRELLRKDIKQKKAFYNPHLVIFQELLLNKFINEIASEKDLIKRDKKLSLVDQQELFIEAMKIYIS